MKNYLNFINEHRNQLVLPFDDTHPLHGKNIIQHIEDALIELSQQGKKYVGDLYSSKKVRDFIDENEDDAFKYYQRWEDDSFLITSFIEHNKSNKNYWLNFESMDEDNLYNIDNESVLLDILTDVGKEEYKKYELEFFNERLDMCGFLNWSYDPEDEDGLIDIWRAVSFRKGSFSDQYENIINYGGVGIYWSWEEDGAEPHGDSWSKDTYILHAKARPESVNWVNTLYKNGSTLNEEREIEMNDGAVVKIIDISRIKKDRNNKTPIIKVFEKPYIVSV
jgi:hypothetical protein